MQVKAKKIGPANFQKEPMELWKTGRFIGRWQAQVESLKLKHCFQTQNLEIDLIYKGNPLFGNLSNRNSFDFDILVILDMYQQKLAQTWPYLS